MKKYVFALLFLVSSCHARQPETPCIGTEEQIFRCQTLRNQEKQMRMMRYMSIQQNQIMWNNYH